MIYVEYGNISSYGKIIKKLDAYNYLVFVESLSKIINIEKKYIKGLDLLFR